MLGLTLLFWMAGAIFTDGFRGRDTGILEFLLTFVVWPGILGRELRKALNK